MPPTHGRIPLLPETIPSSCGKGWKSGDNPITEAVYTTYVLPALAKDLDDADRFRPQSGVIDLGAYEKE
ncbi:MAG: hypothetical protein LBQ61_09925 [Spirochaetales bacterium]|nr:hypothetical protein [Spirochaetales bacterium]